LRRLRAIERADGVFARDGRLPEVAEEPSIPDPDGCELGRRLPTAGGADVRSCPAITGSALPLTSTGFPNATARSMPGHGASPAGVAVRAIVDIVFAGISTVTTAWR